MAFQAVLCLGGIPDAAGYSHPPYHLQCKRHASHKGKHRVVFADGDAREWSTGDRESVLRKRRTRVSSADYVLHIGRPGTDRTYCGRRSAVVNSFGPRVRKEDRSEGEACRSCLTAERKDSADD